MGCRAVIHRLFSLVTASLVKIIGESPTRDHKHRYQRQPIYYSIYVLIFLKVYLAVQDLFYWMTEPLVVFAMEMC